MLDEAHIAMHELEEKHFWYVGARFVYRTMLNMGLGGLDGVHRILEVGSGSGGNLALLEEYGPTVGIDVSTLALKLTPELPSLGLVQASADALPFAKDTFNGIALFAILEHIENDVKALQEANRVCKSGGVVALLTSALPILWSHHDEANRHHRRYYRGEFRDKLIAAGLSPVRISFQNFFTFFPTLAIRLLQRLSPQPPRYDMGSPSKIINRLLIHLLHLESWLIQYFPLPIGVDLVAVCHPTTGGEDSS